jgi:hypothetical protein
MVPTKKVAKIEIFSLISSIGEKSRQLTVGSKGLVVDAFI